MKKIFAILATVTLVLGVFGAASAIPFEDTYDFGGIYMKGTNCYRVSLSWVFDITDDGFDPDNQDIIDAVVGLNLQDDDADWYEYARLNVGDNTFNWEVDTGDVTWELTSLMALSDTGMVDCTLKATGGDYYFNTATLFADATALYGDTNEHCSPGDPAPVPEPATMLLLGCGLVGMSAIGRKSIVKKA